MYKIDSDGATITNEWTNGNPSLGIKATLIDANWLNAVQRELIEVVENAGLTPSDADDTQIRQALDIKLSQVANKTSNTKLDYTGGVLRLVGFDGNVFSASNVGRFIFPDGKNIAITTSPSFTDGLAGNKVGQEFGITNAVNWGNDRPFFIYATYDASDNLYIFDSPDPTKHSTPNAANMIGYHNNASSNNADTDIFVWTATNVTATLLNRPCMLIGCYKAQWNGTSFYWTVTTLDNNDGIGKDFDQVLFTFPSGQMGATSGKFMADNGGTAPIFSTNRYLYSLNTGGKCDIYLELSGDGGTDGAGGAGSLLAMPYKATLQASMAVAPYIFWQSVGAALAGPCQLDLGHGSSTVSLYRLVTATSTTQISNADFPNGSRTLRGLWSFPAFQ